jgi:hypothetical protein
VTGQVTMIDVAFALVLGTGVEDTQSAWQEVAGGR